MNETGGAGRRDLVALVADNDMEQALWGLLSRGAAIGCRQVTAAIYRHLNHDSGCRATADDFLRQFGRQFDFALVMFDREGCGREAQERQAIEQEMEARLQASGWADRSAAVVIDPELEAWLWTDSTVLDEVAGWAGRQPDLRSWVAAQGFQVSQIGKPVRPKEAFRAALRHVRKQPSSALFRQLAGRTSLERCVDPAFNKLKSILCTWFPRHG